MMKGLKPDVEKVDTALLLLDNIQRTKALMKDKNIKIFCRNKLVEGKIYQELLENEVKAKDCFKEVLDLALLYDYTKEKSYKEAETRCQDIQKKEDQKRKEEEEGKKSRDEIIVDLEPELKKLDNAADDDQSFQEFIEFLFKTFPPKHRENAKKPVIKNAENSGEKRR